MELFRVLFAPSVVDVASKTIVSVALVFGDTGLKNTVDTVLASGMSAR